MFNFRRIWLIARREITTRFKTRAYRWTLILQILIALLAGLSPVALSYFMGDSIGGNTVIVVDQPNLGVAERLQANVRSDIPGMPVLTISRYDGDADAAREVVRKGDADAAVLVTESGGKIDYEVVNSGSNPFDLTALQLQTALYTTNVEIAAQQAGITPEQAKALVSPPAVSVQTPGGETNDIQDNFTGPKFVIVNIAMILTYITLLLYGTWIAQGVVEEKASRMMEIMVNAAPPRDLLFGKVLGVLVAGLVQLIPMLAAGGLAFALQPRIASMLGIDLMATFDFNMAGVSARAVIVFLVYFILGYILFGALYAATGSLVSRQEEVNQAVGPVMILVIVAFFVGYGVMAAPDALFSRIAFVVPFTAPFVSMARILLGTPSALEIAASIGILALSGVLAMVFAARIYRTGVLMYGQKGGFLQLFKLRRFQQVSH